MANPEMVEWSSAWLPIAGLLVLVAGLLMALKMSSPSGSKGDRS